MPFWKKKPISALVGELPVPKEPEASEMEWHLRPGSIDRLVEAPKFCGGCGEALIPCYSVPMDKDGQSLYTGVSYDEKTGAKYEERTLAVCCPNTMDVPWKDTGIHYSRGWWENRNEIRTVPREVPSDGS